MRVADGISKCADDLWTKAGMRCDGYEAAMATNVHRDFVREVGRADVRSLTTEYGTVSIVHEQSLPMDMLILRPSPELYTDD